MKILKTVIAATLLIGSVASSAFADDQAIVQKFYDFLSNPASQEHADAFRATTADNWESIGNYSGVNKTTDQFVGQLGGFSRLIPDLKWEVQEMIQEGGRIVVRSRATGTPTGPLFGVDGNGKGFDMLTIDIHTVVDGKIVNTYHVEDWAGALQQLGSK